MITVLCPRTKLEQKELRFRCCCSRWEFAFVYSKGFRSVSNEQSSLFDFTTVAFDVYLVPLVEKLPRPESLWPKKGRSF